MSNENHNKMSYKNFVDINIAGGKIKSSGNNGSVDLSNYYTKKETDVIVEECLEESKNYTDQQISNIQIPEDYVTHDELDAIDTRLTDVEQSYASEEYVNTKIGAIDLSSYATKTYVDTAVKGIDLSNYYTKAQTEEYVSGIVGDINTILDEINGEVV